MNYRSEIAELTRYFVALSKIYDVFYNKTKIEVDISRDNPRIREFLLHLDKIEKEIYQAFPLNPVAFQTNEPVSLIIISSREMWFEHKYNKYIDVSVLEHYEFKPNIRYSYEFIVYPEFYYISLLMFRKARGNNLRGEEIVRFHVRPEYSIIGDILSFALNYPVFKKILRPEHFKPYVKLFRALFGEEG